MLYINLFPANELFLGARISRVNIVNKSESYNPDKEYPTHYLVEVGLIFFTLTWRSS